jgi:hypothetical protein
MEVYSKAVLGWALPNSCDLKLPVVLTQIRTPHIRVRRAMEGGGDAKEHQISVLVPPLE